MTPRKQVIKHLGATEKNSAHLRGASGAGPFRLSQVTRQSREDFCAWHCSCDRSEKDEALSHSSETTHKKTKLLGICHYRFVGGFVLAGCSGDLTSDAESGNTKDDSSAGADSNIVSPGIDDSNLVDAVAVTCSGAGCDGKDPVKFGLRRKRGQHRQPGEQQGNVLPALFHGPFLRVADWVHVGNYAGGSSASDGKLNLTAYDQTREKFVRFLASPTPGTHYGNMVYSPGSNCAYGLAGWNDGEWDVVIASSGCAALTADGTSMSSPLAETAQSTATSIDGRCRIRTGARP